MPSSFYSAWYGAYSIGGEFPKGLEGRLRTEGSGFNSAAQVYVEDEPATTGPHPAVTYAFPFTPDGDEAWTNMT